MNDKPEFTGTGTETDPMVFDVMHKTAPDPVDTAVAGLAATSKKHSAAFSATADLSYNLPADIREIVGKASIAIMSTMNTARGALVKAESFRNDIRLYPEGRNMLAGEALKTAADKVAESFEQADTQIDVATALTYEAARPKLTPDAAMPARADLAMLAQRAAGNPGTLVETLKRLAQRGDAVGALVADTGYLSDFLEAYGVDAQTREAALTIVGAEVVKAAALSADPKRAAAGKTNLALTSCIQPGM